MTTKQLQQYFPHAEWPLIVQAPMAYTAGGAIAGAVSSAGGLGFIGAGYMSDASWIEAELQQAETILTRDPTTGRLPVGVGLITWHLLTLKDPVDTSAGNDSDIQNGWQQLLARVLAMRPAALWFSFGNPLEAVHWIRDYEQRHATTVGARCPIFVQVQSVGEACQLAQHREIDIIVAQGSEAGGHGARQGASMFCLVPEVVDALANVRQVPVLAAGGIADGRGVAAAHMLGADAVVVGTRFIATPEALGKQSVKETILRTTDGGLSTVRTDVFDVMRGFDWPAEYDIRALRNTTTDAAARGLPLPDKQAYAEAAQTGNTEIAMACAGQVVGLVRQLTPAAELTRQLRQEAKQVLQQQRP